MSVIACYNVSKAYGDHWAVHNLDLQIPRGAIFALVGPNGAGKSSTIKMLATLLEPTGGRILIDGYDAQLEPQAVRRRVGYLPDHFTLYEDMSVEACLDFYGSCHGMGKGDRRRRVGELLAMLDLEVKRQAPIKDLSRGMKQRVGIARALMHGPQVLLLDEPASGLDPAARVRLRSALVRLKEEGMTILVSSHILMELSTFCDSMAILQRGRVLEVGSIEEIQTRLGGGRVPLTLRLLSGHERAAGLLEAEFQVQEIERTGKALRFNFSARPEDTAELVAALVRADLQVVGVERGESDMERVYASISTHEIN